MNSEERPATGPDRLQADHQHIASRARVNPEMCIFNQTRQKPCLPAVASREGWSNYILHVFGANGADLMAIVEGDFLGFSRSISFYKLVS
jgi:hypothetical protein